jgi:hypothetical protein
MQAISIGHSFPVWSEGAKQPSLITIFQLAKALDISASDMLGLAERKLMLERY